MEEFDEEYWKRYWAAVEDGTPRNAHDQVKEFSLDNAPKRKFIIMGGVGIINQLGTTLYNPNITEKDIDKLVKDLQDMGVTPESYKLACEIAELKERESTVSEFEQRLDFSFKDCSIVPELERPLTRSEIKMSRENGIYGAEYRKERSKTLDKRARNRKKRKRKKRK